MKGLVKLGIVAVSSVVADAAVLTGMRYGMSNETKELTRDVVLGQVAFMDDATQTSNKVVRGVTKLYSKMMISRMNFVCNHVTKGTQKVNHAASKKEGYTVLNGN